jgi:hypothetical protein
MNSRERLTTDPFEGGMVDQLTNVQKMFRRRAAGRWQADAQVGVVGPLFHVRRTADGTVESTRMDCDDASWFVSPDVRVPGGMMVGRL